MGEDIGVFGGAFKVTDGFFDEFGADARDGHAAGGVGDHRHRDRRGRRRHAAGLRDAVRRLHRLRLRPARQRRGEDALPPGPGGAHHRAAAVAAAASPAARFTPRTPRRGSCTRPGSRSSRRRPPRTPRACIIAAMHDPNPVVLHGAQAPLPPRQGRGAPRAPTRRRSRRASRARATTSSSSPTARWSTWRSRRRRPRRARRSWCSTCARSCRSTSRRSSTPCATRSKVVIVDEANVTCAAGAQVAALIAEHAFEDLDGPVVRVASPDVPDPVLAAARAGGAAMRRTREGGVP